MWVFSAVGWLKKKPDTSADRARDWNDGIAELEAEIKRLSQQVESNPAPRLRSTSVPHRATSEVAVRALPAHSASEPIFEEVDQALLKNRAENANSPAHYNELGVRKYELPGMLRRLRNHFRGPAATNPKLVSYLAAGGIQGLRPLRYEKRVARNRFILLVAGLFLMLLGLIWMIVRNGR